MTLATALTDPPFAATVQPAVAALGAAAWLTAGIGMTIGMRWVRRRHG